MNTIIIILIGILFASSGQILWKIGMTDIGPITSVTTGSFISMLLSPWVIGERYVMGFPPFSGLLLYHGLIFHLCIPLLHLPLSLYS